MKKLVKKVFRWYVGKYTQMYGPMIKMGVSPVL